jgi:hypothetical protein
VSEFRLFLSNGPADEVRVRRPEWRLWDAPGLGDAAPDPLPEHVWLCRIEWGEFEWRVRLTAERIRGKSALYRLERDPDGSPQQAVSGAFVYAHVPDEEMSAEEARSAAGVLG